MFESIISSELTPSAFFICTAVSLILGIGTAAVGMFKSRSTQSFAITLAILPVTVQLVIMLVNGNIGAGVAVAGAFSLVRFRSAPGNAREICALFCAMAVGLATAMRADCPMTRRDFSTVFAVPTSRAAGKRDSASGFPLRAVLRRDTAARCMCAASATGR